MSIMPQDPESNNQHPASLRGVAERMSASPDPFTMNVGWMVDYVAVEHEAPVTCDWCSADDDAGYDRTLPCLSYANALSVAFAWLLKVVEERG